MTQWDFQDKGNSGWTGKDSFVLKVPLRYLRPSVIYSVPCDRILRIIKLLGLLPGLVIAGSFGQEMLVPDVTLSLIKPN